MWPTVHKFPIPDRATSIVAILQVLDGSCDHQLWTDAKGMHGVQVIDILQASAVTGYTRDSYSIRSRGAAVAV